MNEPASFQPARLTGIPVEEIPTACAVEPERFHAALRRMDEENSRDPNIELVEGTPFPKELLYARRLTDWVLRLDPSASETLLLASRGQHLCRWIIPRQSYAMTRVGYLKWRTDLKSFHAGKVGEVLTECGYPDERIRRVQALNLKKGFPDDPETRLLEDALCLVFLQFQLAELAAKTAEDKVIGALQKSWNKMTVPARDIALQLDYGAKERELIDRALHA